MARVRGPVRPAAPNEIRAIIHPMRMLAAGGGRRPRGAAIPGETQIMTNRTTIAALLALALVGFAPAATAMESFCIENACVNHEDEAWGEGSCAESADYDAYRGYSVTISDESSVTGAYVYQYCWTYDDGENAGDGTAMSIAVSYLNWEEFAQEGAFLYWESAEWNGEGYCGMMLHTHTGPVPGVFEPVPCIAGDAPPMVLPALP